MICHLALSSHLFVFNVTELCGLWGKEVSPRMAMGTLAATVLLWGGLTWTAVDGHSTTSEVAAAVRRSEVCFREKQRLPPSFEYSCLLW